MKRTEKIDLIKSGKYVIENDMKGSKKAKKVLKSINESLVWYGSDNFYGFHTKGVFNSVFGSLWESQLNDRPRFKMSELILSKSNKNEPKEFITRDELKKLDFNLSYDELATKLNQMAFDAYKTK